MFGYITLAPEGLNPQEQEHYHAVYCGMCHSIRKRHGQVAGIALSYDMVFLAILLQAMYEEREEERTGVCPPHPFQKHKYLCGPVIDYCADMNLILAYHKALDDCADENSLKGKTAVRLLEKSYQKIRQQYPEICKQVEEALSRIALLEKQESPSLDELVNLSGELLGSTYAYRKDYWAGVIKNVGKGLGRFIYLMDAYEDLPEDLKKQRFNPLKEMSREPGYEALIKDSLTLLVAEATENLEVLPLTENTELLRNILYAGCWSKYESIYAQRNKTIPAEKSQGGNQ